MASLEQQHKLQEILASKNFAKFPKSLNQSSSPVSKVGRKQSYQNSLQKKSLQQSLNFSAKDHVKEEPSKFRTSPGHTIRPVAEEQQTAPDLHCRQGSAADRHPREEQAHWFLTPHLENASNYLKHNQSFKQARSPHFSFLQQSPSRVFSIEKVAASSQSTEVESKSLDTFQVKVHVADQVYSHQVDTTKTTDWLEKHLLRLHPLPDLVNFVTVDKNLPLDYYLQLPAKPLLPFRNQVLALQPFTYAADKKSSRVTLKDFIFLKCIGIGGFSRVYLVKKKENGRFYAMKLIDKEFILKNKKQGIVQNERDIMTVLEHPYIVKLEQCFESRNFIVFVVEFCSGGELFFQLRQVKRMKEHQARFYFIEICLAMLHLHSLSVVYRDVKPENILIDVEGHVRLADFGLSKPNVDDENFAYSFCGSPEYMAPEMLLKIGHNVQVDHYCLGALLFELVTGLPPYYSRDTAKIYEAILNEQLKFPEGVVLSKELKVFVNPFLIPPSQHLLAGLLTKSPHQRLGTNAGLEEILAHPWFKDVNLLDYIDKKVPPPFKPNPFKFNFDQTDLNKGELETRDKLLGRAGFNQDIRIFDIFYFDATEKGALKAEQDKLFTAHLVQLRRLQSVLDKKYNQHQYKKAEQYSSSSYSISSTGNTPTSGKPLLRRIVTQNNFLVEKMNTEPDSYFVSKSTKNAGRNWRKNP